MKTRVSFAVRRARLDDAMGTLIGLLRDAELGELTGPSRECLNSVVLSLEQRDYTLAAALARHGRAVAKACKDRLGDAVLELCHGVALCAMSIDACDHPCEGVPLMERAKSSFQAHHTVAAQHNAAVACACLGVFYGLYERQLEAAAQYRCALQLVGGAGRRYAEQGDNGSWRHMREMGTLVYERIVARSHMLYVDGTA